MYLTINSFEEYWQVIEQQHAALVYFSHESCNVCKVLKPKIMQMIEASFPKMALIYCNTVQNPEIAAQFSIFTVPAILVYFDGKECIRKNRNIGVEELHELIKRPYALLFSSVYF